MIAPIAKTNDDSANPRALWQFDLDPMRIRGVARAPGRPLVSVDRSGRACLLVLLAVCGGSRAAAEAAYTKARPLDNTDFVMNWRKQMTRQYTLRALQELASLD